MVTNSTFYSHSCTPDRDPPTPMQASPLPPNKSTSEINDFQLKHLKKPRIGAKRNLPKTMVFIVETQLPPTVSNVSVQTQAATLDVVAAPPASNAASASNATPETRLQKIGNMAKKVMQVALAVLLIIAAAYFAPLLLGTIAAAGTLAKGVFIGSVAVTAALTIQYQRHQRRRAYLADQNL